MAWASAPEPGGGAVAVARVRIRVIGPPDKRKGRHGHRSAHMIGSAFGCGGRRVDGVYGEGTYQAAGSGAMAPHR